MLLLGGCFGLAGSFLGFTTHDLLDTDREGAPRLDTHAREGKEGSARAKLVPYQGEDRPREPAAGLVLIHDYLLDDTHTGPLIPALFALCLTMVSEPGQVYSGAELHALLAQARFEEVHIKPFLTGHSSLVIARPAGTAQVRGA